MKRSPIKSNPETHREWQERTRRKQIEAQRNGSQRRKRIKAKRKSARERDQYIARVYGSRERLLAIKALPCAASGKVDRSGKGVTCSWGLRENHHLENGGMGRKGPWWTIVPACLAHHTVYHKECGSPEAFDARFGTDLRALAAELAERIPADGRAA